MRKETITIYEFDELSEDSKQKAIEQYRECAMDYEWWDCIYQDAQRVGMEITSFDCDRHKIEAKLHLSIGEIAAKVISEHGGNCDTYQVAKDYYYAKNCRQPWTKEDFKLQILGCYLTMLQKDWEFLTSDDAIIEAIQANEYDFTADGKVY